MLETVLTAEVVNIVRALLAARDGFGYVGKAQITGNNIGAFCRVFVRHNYLQVTIGSKNILQCCLICIDLYQRLSGSWRAVQALG